MISRVIGSYFVYSTAPATDRVRSGCHPVARMKSVMYSSAFSRPSSEAADPLTDRKAEGTDESSTSLRSTNRRSARVSAEMHRSRDHDGVAVVIQASMPRLNHLLQRAIRPTQRRDGRELIRDRVHMAVPGGVNNGDLEGHDHKISGPASCRSIAQHART